ncbi:MAG: hypothetical protein IJ437_01690 [Clostridia bacterium]|nr:hypothetical protein [Clostridia bacterium]
MIDKYKITEEEINQTILHSPYSLADCPASAGLKAKQVKKYFYEFIRFFADKINVHLNDIGVTLENYDEINDSLNTALADILLLDEKIYDLEDKDTELGNQICAQISAHNTSSESHNDIRQKIDVDLSSHNESALAHSDLREKIKSLLDKIEVTYSLASGKSRLHSCEDVLAMLDEIDGAGEICKGDLFLIADSSLPDFTVFEVSLDQAPDGSVELDYNAIASGEVTLERGKSYYYNGIRLISSLGNLETNLLAKNEELQELESAFYHDMESIRWELDEIIKALDTKQSCYSVLESSEEEIVVESQTEYNLGLRTSLTISFGEVDSGFEAIVNFRTGATAPSFEAPSELVFSGDDSYAGRFYPITNRIYEISLKNVLGVMIARVGATDYEVIE